MRRRRRLLGWGRGGTASSRPHGHANVHTLMHQVPFATRELWKRDTHGDEMQHELTFVVFNQKCGSEIVSTPSGVEIVSTHCFVLCRDCKQTVPDIIWCRDCVQTPSGVEAICGEAICGEAICADSVGKPSMGKPSMGKPSVGGLLLRCAWP